MALTSSTNLSVKPYMGMNGIQGTTIKGLVVDLDFIYYTAKMVCIQSVFWPVYVQCDMHNHAGISIVMHRSSLVYMLWY